MPEELAIVPYTSGQPPRVGPLPVLLPIVDFRLAVALCVFRARLLASCPLEWIDEHESRESFLRYLESRKRGEEPPTPAPKPLRIWNFDGRTMPKADIVKAFGAPLETLDAELELIVAGLETPVRRQLRDAVSKLVMRACHETLLWREWLGNQAKNMPENAKFDGIRDGRRVVRIGKNSSAELRQHYLSKLP